MHHWRGEAVASGPPLPNELQLPPRPFGNRVHPLLRESFSQYFAFTPIRDWRLINAVYISPQGILENK